jgi:ribonuclease D
MLITDNEALGAFCAALVDDDFITVDTEFLRDKTYWAQLCLVQVAGAERAAAIDPLAPGIDLAPLYDLLARPQPLKVFHAARQDIEIFVQATGAVPSPLFDTQVAAMVCGYGEQASYETLASKLAKAKIDKSHRYTDWAARPLSAAQIDYAMADVTHLRVVYRKLAQQLRKSGRTGWVEAELATLCDPATYRMDPRDAWIRLKPRAGSPKFLNILQAVAAWREAEAQRRNLPRNRLLKDEAVLEVAALAPRSIADLARSRAVGRGVAEGALGPVIIDTVAAALELPASAAPRLPEKPEAPPYARALVEMLKVLLRHKCDTHDVAEKLVATVADLEAIAADDDADVAALKGWRRELFGADALALKHGGLWLGAVKGRVRVVYLDLATPDGG